MKRNAIAWSLLALSTLGGIVSVYYLLFSIWMSAHPLYDSDAWHTRYYERLAITALDGLVWIGSILWLLRLSANAERSGDHSPR